jgi:putative ABC transport system permease protein
VVSVPLTACANVANLLIARSESRRREIAVRTAIGAGRGRLLRQLVTESCVLLSVAAVAGLLLARTMVAAVLAVSPVPFPSFIEPGVDLRMTLFTAIVAIVCGVLVGLAPAVHSRSVDLNDALKESSRGSDGRRSQRLRSGLVVAEIALAVVLLVGAGLMIRTVAKLAAIDPGFDPQSVLTLRVSIPRAPVAAPAPGAPAPGGPAPLVVQARALVERIRALPGVTAATLSSDLPLDGTSGAVFYSAEGQPPVNAQNMPRAYLHRVSPDFFSVLRIPLAGGRTFTDAELTPDPQAVIVSERVVRRFWPGESGVGRRIKGGPPDSKAPWMTIVGVVREVKYRGLPENPTADPDIYLPFLDRSQQVAIAVRSSVPPESAASAVRAAIRTADPTIVTYSVRTMDELVSGMTARSRFTMWLMGIFAGVALALAVIGIYGVMSYLVTQRTREIGIRLALGADRPDIVRLVVGNGARLIAIGIAIGVLGAFALQRAVASLLYGVTAADVASGVAVAVLAAVALAACYLPAARATRVDPLHALRCD